MSVASDLVTALTATGLPIAQMMYAGTASTYITFNCWTVPEHYADDAPRFEMYHVNVHLLAPLTTNTTALQAQIKALLVADGFTYPSTRDVSDDEEQHIVFDTAIAVDIGD